MKYYLLTISFLLLTLFTACDSSTLTTNKPATYESDLEVKKLYETTTEHAFSIPNKKDRFKLALIGSSILTAKVKFTILSHDGKIVYEENFKSTDLLDAGVLDVSNNPSNAEKETYILQRMDSFFDQDNFMNPAIKSEETLEKEYSDEQIWKAIREDKTAIGFYYLLNAEDGRSIAYAKKLNKVVMYFNCC